MTLTSLTASDDGVMPDSLTIGRRIRQLRTERGLTLDDLGVAIGRAASQVSVVENGKRELRLGELQRFATALDVSLDDLLDTTPPSRRAALEIALERVQRGPLFASLGLPPLPVRRSLSDEAIETILGLHSELERIHTERAATPEEARRANTQLRGAMRLRHNHFPELEATASDLLDAVGHSTGPLSQRLVSELAAHLGFSLHYVPDLPSSVRSVRDLEHGRIYVPLSQRPDADPRSVVLQALAGHVLGHGVPQSYAEFLQQRVETNYLAAALLIPAAGAVPLLVAAKEARELSVEDLRDAFGVSYETAAHRFTNLATEHLGIPVHFLKVDSEGTISKAYENDSVLFPTDALGAVEGQTVCRYWSARQVFDVADRFSPYHQYTDKPTGTYWCTSRIQTSSRGGFSVSVGTSFAHAKWFRGRDTTTRFTSRCPDESCCRRPPSEVSSRWSGRSFPTPRLNSSLHAAMPTGAFPGVDTTELYDFLTRHSPTD
ncbi:helix-turn-helix domain-containing protein [Cnuibacter sp. UC19_7]|uniref:helix-turn-helix domain-containing protein n=1 Tax=Cnuibacter sp. UC19_7 TaxID=3350166 RepID=UPI0036731203